MTRHRFAALAEVPHDHDGVECDAPVWDEGHDGQGNHGGPCHETGDWIEWSTT